MANDLLVTIARVRRAMPRNPDVMLICDEAERMYIKVTADRVESKAAADVTRARLPVPPPVMHAADRAEGKPTPKPKSDDLPFLGSIGFGKKKPARHK